MENTDILTMPIRGRIRASYRPELYAVGVYTSEADVVFMYKEYTGSAYKPFVKKLHDLLEEPYFYHKGGRVYLSEFDALNDDMPTGCALILGKNSAGFCLSY